MPVGVQLTKAIVDNNITQLSLELRQICTAITQLSTNVNGQGTGLATLEAAGYTAADAATAQNAIGFLNTVAGVYFGTVQQGGSGGTGATLFNFNNQLSQFWGGQ